MPGTLIGRFFIRTGSLFTAALTVQEISVNQQCIGAHRNAK
jgi:hypothetical protein